MNAKGATTLREGENATDIPISHTFHEGRTVALGFKPAERAQRPALVVARAQHRGDALRVVVARPTAVELGRRDEPVRVGLRADAACLHINVDVVGAGVEETFYDQSQRSKHCYFQRSAFYKPPTEARVESRRNVPRVESSRHD